MHSVDRCARVPGLASVQSKRHRSSYVGRTRPALRSVLAVEAAITDPRRL